MQCPDCQKFVSPFDEKCSNCGAALKENPIKNYANKADEIIGKADARADDILSQMRSGFKGQSFSKNVSGSNVSSPDVNNLDRSSFLHAHNNIPKPAKEATAKKIEMTDINKEWELWLKIIKERKEVKVKEMYHHVFGVNYVIGGKDYAPKATITDFIYRMENGNSWTAPNLMEPYATDQSPLTVNAYACYHEEVDRYEISLFDGFLNFLLGVEAFFVYKNEKILLDLIEHYYVKKEISAKDVLGIIYLNHDKEYKINESELLDLIENAFLPCFEVIAHELGHVCLGHCRLDLSANRDVETIRIHERQADGFASAIINSFFNYNEDTKKVIFLAYIKNELVWTLKDKLTGQNKPFTHPLSEERLKNAIRNNATIAQELSITEEWVDEIVSKILSKIEVLPR